MKILTSYPHYDYGQKFQKQSALKFGHHPDLEIMLRAKSPVLISRWFRRGYKEFEPGEYFPDVVKVLDNLFREVTKPVRILIVGVANSEEPLSYLAVTKQIIKSRPIEDSVDLHIIDLQSKPSTDKLFKDSYYTLEHIPDYAKDSFIYDPQPQISKYKYRVKDELFRFLHKVYNDSSKSKWETRVQEAIKTYPDNYFDLVSINYVSCYMKSNDIQTTGDNIYRILNPHRYIIEDSGIYAQMCKYADNFKPVDLGIHEKL